MIDRSTIDRVLAATDIVDVVRQFVPLRRAGVNYKGLCPFHEDKTPSFYVSPARGVCKCFACGTGGDAVGFLMKHEQLSYPEAIKWLGKKYGIEVVDKELSDEEKAAQNDREAMFVLNEWARDWFVHALKHDPDGVSIGLPYFRSRGFRDDIIAKFQLGYCPERRGFSMGAEAIQKGYSEEYLLKTGLCFKTEQNRLIDRYHGRVIFPVHTISGRIVAFGGRILGEKNKHVGKYVNSPESEIYNKSNQLYGLYLAKQAITKHNRCYLVEGYTDVMRMHQSGIENVVASSGTSLTDGQIRLLGRFTKNITILYDGDAAGIKASLRGIDMLLAHGMNIKVLLLPDGEDPDSFARSHTTEELQTYIAQHETDFIRFKTDLLLGDTQGDPTQRAAVITNIVQSISVIPEALVRQMYVRECASMMGIGEGLLIDEISKLRRQRFKRERQQREAQTAQPASTNNGSVSAEIAGVPASSAVPSAEIADHLAAEAAEAAEARETQRNIQQATSATSNTRIARQELQIAALIVRHGERRLEEGDESISVVQYIANDLAADDIIPSTSILSTILTEGAQLANSEHWRAATYFMHHPDASISAFAAQQESDFVLLSPSQLTGYTEEKDRLPELISLQLNTLKYYILSERLDNLRRSLLTPEVRIDMRKTLDILSQIKSLSSIVEQFGKALDRVVK
ncbi:MAG: DNA primase [Bacteroidaceae bacterium]|nr:DNA primase [Bacteroidaceae bacterium]